MSREVIGLAALMLVVGCAELAPHTPEGDERAFSIAWEGVYGMARADRPALTWYESTNCDDGTGPGVLNPYGQCLGGWTLVNPLRVHVLWVHTYGSPSVFAHELMHARKWLLYADLDHAHSGPEWSTLVPEAEAAL